jgi:hypothetical protein
MTPQRLHPQLEDMSAVGLRDARSVHGGMLPGHTPNRTAREAPRRTDRAQAHLLPNRKREANPTGARGG